MSNNLVEQWDDYVESMGSVMGEVEHMAQRMADRIEELEAKLAKAVEALEGLVELHDLSTNEINPKTVLECAYTTLAELTGDTP